MAGESNSNISLSNVAVWPASARRQIVSYSFRQGGCVNCSGRTRERISSKRSGRLTSTSSSSYSHGDAACRSAARKGISACIKMRFEFVGILGEPARC